MDLNTILKKFQEGKKGSAYYSLKLYLQKNPNDLIAVYNFAYMSELLNKKHEAKHYYAYLNNKDRKNWKSRFNLYLLYIESKEYIKALSLINEVLNLKPDYQPALRDRALTNHYLGKNSEALNDILRSLKFNKKDYIAINILGLIYEASNNFIKAKEVYESGIKLNPKYPPGFNNYGSCLLKLGDVENALKNFMLSFNLDRKFEQVINNIANIYLIKGKYNKAIQYYKKALDEGGDSKIIYYNIGVALSFLKDYKKAEIYYDMAYKLNPNDDTLNKNIAILNIAKQNFKKAWKFYDGRLKLNDFVKENKSIEIIKDKLWDGDKISAKENILIVKEQGVGDEIVFSSMYPDLLKKFPNCKIETEMRLLSIFKRSFKDNKNFINYNSISKKKDKLKKFDKVIYAGSLGRLFRNEIKDFPMTPFLFCEKQKKDLVKQQLNKISKKPKIGITWSSKRMVYGSDKSINLDILKPILEIDSFDFINLQYGDTTKEIGEFQKLSNIKIHNIKNIDLFNDFESIAALLKNLDLFITVSNSTAHLAGALGVPTFLIKPKSHSVFFYWNVPSDKTPWYSSIKLFEFRDRWENTINDILIELKSNFKFTS